MPVTLNIMKVIPFAATTSRRCDIDVLRGLAILAILLLHAGVMTEGLNVHPHLAVIVSRLSVGIQLFFVISGSFRPNYCCMK